MKIGRLIMIAVMLMVASLTISAQSVPRDLQTELSKFWPDQASLDKNVWQLFPVDVSEIDVYPEGFFAIKAPLGGYAEEFYVSDQSNGAVEFDSEFYKLNFDKTAPTVKGLVFYLNSKYHPKDVYIGIIYDDRIVKSNIGKQRNKDDKDEFNRPFYKVNQADFKADNDQDPGSYDTGIPIIRYGANSENNLVATPKMIVKVFKVAHPVGDFMEYHQGQKLEKIILEGLDKSQPESLRIIKEFPNDYFYPLDVGFVFDDKKEEFYGLYGTSSGYLILASLDFFDNWKP